MAFISLLTPAPIYMLQQPQLFPSIPCWALVLRMPLQLALLALIAWVARTSLVQRTPLPSV